ncbi:MAG: exodeoxyribonuclease VII large subunit [Clostridia bacterium]|nr:exodeoxyribonuclease VII large subunit [Clostridia bacterium]
MKIRPMSVTEINSYIGRQLKYDPILGNAIIVGEISNFKVYNSGHAYFTLKDENSKISCVMFNSAYSGLDYNPKEGEKTEIRGSIGVYEKEGRYQIYVEDMAPMGQGALFQAFMKQKEYLEKQGYFLKQRPIKKFPDAIGIVTSKTGAALRDMLTVLKRRNPKVKVIVCHASVQGQYAAFEIARGIDYFNETKKVDTIIVARGGGSLEELWAFNEMPVVEAIYSSNIPVISGVGHETDFTLTDFVADHRGATPTEAAEFSASPLEEYILFLKGIKTSMFQLLNHKIEIEKNTLERYHTKYLCQLISNKINDYYTNIDSSWNILHNKTTQKLSKAYEQLNLYGESLHALSPLSTLSRGYSVVKKKEETVRSISEVNLQDRIDIILKNGIIKAEVIAKEEKDFNGH